MKTKPLEICRRKFTAVAFGGLFASVCTRGASESVEEKSEAERFADFAGDEFVMGSSVVVLERVDVRSSVSVGQLPKGTRVESFSLLFKPVSDNGPGSDIHSVRHPVLGEFPLYVNETRVGATAEEIRYEAIFN